MNSLNVLHKDYLEAEATMSDQGLIDFAIGGLADVYTIIKRLHAAQPYTKLHVLREALVQSDAPPTQATTPSTATHCRPSQVAAATAAAAAATARHGRAEAP